MVARKVRGTRSLAAKAAELAFAVPQVVAHRVTRMALSGYDNCVAGDLSSAEKIFKMIMSAGN